MNFKLYREWLNEQAKPNFGIVHKDNIVAFIDLANLISAYEKIKNEESADKYFRFNTVLESKSIVSMIDFRKVDSKLYEIRSTFTLPDYRNQGHSKTLRKYILSNISPRYLTIDPESNTRDEMAAWTSFLETEIISDRKTLEDGRQAVSTKTPENFSIFENSLKNIINNISQNFGKKSSFMKQDIPLVLTQVAERIFMDNVKAESLNESKLSEYWKMRAKKRALRGKRKYPNKVDREWAILQQENSTKINDTFKKLYEEEIELTTELATNIDEFLKKVKESKIELVAPTPKNLKTRPKPGKNPYLDPKYRKTKFKSRMDYLKNVHVGDINPITEAAQLLTYGDLKKLISLTLNKERAKVAAGEVAKLGVDQILGLIPGASNAKSAFDFVKSIYAATDDKKTNTFLDKINVDDEYSKIVDDKVEMAFIKFLTQAIESTPDQTPLPSNFDVNIKLQDYLKQNYKARTLAGGQ
jgi:hypothetical protein